jgi:hypothetical protein
MIKELIIQGIVLSQGKNVQFTEIQLAEALQLGIQEIRSIIAKKELNTFFHLNKRSLPCPHCGYELAEIEDCPACKAELKPESLAKFNLGIKSNACAGVIQDRLTTKFIEDHWEKKDDLLRKNNVTISIKVIPSCLTKKGVMALLGETKVQKKCNEVLLLTLLENVHEIIADLSGFTTVDIRDFLKKEKEVSIMEDFNRLAEISKEINIVEIDLEGIKTQHQYICEHIQQWACQDSKEEASKMGYSFEGASLALMYSPLFPAKQIKMKYIDDGGIFYPAQQIGSAGTFIPISVKSATRQPFQITQPVLEQMRKYLRGILTTQIMQHYAVPYYILIVDRIDPEDEENNKAILTLQEEFKGTSIVVMPLNVLIRIHKLTNEHQIHFPGMINNILKFLGSSRYLTLEDVEILFQNLKKLEEGSYETFTLKKIQDEVKKSSVPLRPSKKK